MVKRTRVLDVPVRVERAEGRMRIMEAGTPTNAQIASELEAIADLLDLTETNTFRVRAYRQGAQQVKQAGEPLADLVMRGAMERLTDLPGIGRGLAGVIAEYVMTGRTGLHQELLSEVSPEDAFRRIPGIGGGLARRAAETLGISTLEELERAAHDGRLARVEGFGKRRVEMVRAALAGMLGGSALKRSRTVASEAPSVAQRPRWTCCWKSTGSTAERPRKAGCEPLHPGDSTRKASPGSRSCACSRKDGTSLRCTPIPPGPTSWVKPATGS